MREIFMSQTRTFWAIFRKFYARILKKKNIYVL